ncbi:MAG: DUF1002 domain-containing protein [Thermincolia bacterium]
MRLSKKAKSLAGVLMVMMLWLATTVTTWADTSRVLTLGADLTDADRQKVAAIFGIQDINKTPLPVIQVTNQEERTYLKGFVPLEVIGDRAISSASVEILSPGSGIQVETRNITWVTSAMYTNALVTARVKDARVIAAAPYPVSGTAALTGILKGFEEATGRKLDEQAKRIANEELVRMGDLGQELGSKEKAAQLIMGIKEEVIRNNVTDPEQIRQIIINIAGDLNINLTQAQTDELVNLMKKISGLDLTMGEINNQLQGIKAQLNEVLGKQEEVRGFFQQILAAIRGFIDWLMSLLG